MQEKKRRAAALLLTYIFLFVVLDEFCELKVPGDDGDLEREETSGETEKEETKRHSSCLHQKSKAEQDIFHTRGSCLLF